MKGIRFTQEQIDEYVSQGYWELTTMVDVFEQNARDYPEKEAVVDSKKRLTWLQVKQFSDRLALKLLELGIKRDQVMVAQLPNVVEVFILHVAFRKAGIISTFPPMVFRHNEMEYTLKHLEAVGVVTLWKFRDFDHFQMIQDIRPNLPDLRYTFVVGDDVPPGAISISEILQRPLEERYPEDYLDKFRLGAFDISTLFLTSGTTGLPKCVEIPEAASKLAGRGVIDRTKATSEDIFGAIGPLSGASNFMATWLAPPQLPATVALLERFDPEEALRLVERERVTIINAVPAQAIRMLRHPNLDKYDLSSVRVVTTGTGPFDAASAAEMEERAGCRVSIRGGASETFVFGSTSVDDPPHIRLNTLGKPPIGIELKIVDDAGKEVTRGEPGELLVRGAPTSSGYYKDVEATKQAWRVLGKEGWYHTGDIAQLDEEGNLTIVGRKKDMILRGGQNIFPKEIEDLLRMHPKVSDVAVVSMPDSELGEKACAYIIVKPGEQLSFEEMVSFLKERKLSTYKLPERLEVVDRFPMVSDVQKVDRKALRQDIAKKLQIGR